MRKVFIMRGLPGSGKTTVAEQLYESFPDSSIIVSADKYMYMDGVYKFEESKLAYAHHQCKTDFKRAIDAYIGQVIVDNTNIERRHLKWFVDYAHKRGYIVVTCTIEDFDVDACARRTKHGVPKDIVARMARGFQR